LSIFDRNYNQFIYIAASVTETASNILLKYGINLNKESIFDIVQDVYEINRRILIDGFFEKPEIDSMAVKYFHNNPEKAESFLKELKLQSVSAVEIMSSKKNFKCFFHILTELDIDKKFFKIEDEYIAQLNIALEIIFLVRELYIKATHDSLTKLFNHKQGIILLEREIVRVDRNKSPLIAVMVDLDAFKNVNDKYGHQAGDSVLKSVSGIFSSGLRKSDIISRYGGEEFLIVLPDTPIESTIEVLKRIKDDVQNNVYHNAGDKFSITASFGVAVYNAARHKDASSLIEEADEYLLKAKKNGRNRIEY
jgi:diguanylate cyclase (GGDEF)-like protein